MKKIAFILPDLNQGGAERVITILCNELDRNRFKPIIILFKKEGHYLEFLKDDVEIHELNVSRIRYSIFKLLPLLMRLRPCIVFSGWGEISAFLSPIIPIFRKTKFITRETNIVSKHVKRKEILFFYRFYNNFHQIIAQSDDMKNDLIRNFKISPTKIIKINNPVDFDLINKKLKENIILSFQSNKKNVVAVGTLLPRKGFDLLLHVFKHLRDEPIHLYIIGDGSSKNKLISLKEKLKLNNVTFLGKVNNPFMYLYKSDLFVLSSRYEGFPNILLEAGSCGKYSLVNDCPGGIDEIIIPNVNGEVHNIKNESKFADRIRILVSKSFDSEKIKSSIFDRFNKKFIVKKFETVFDK